MKVVLSGGGTAGHINPALALAEVLKHFIEPQHHSNRALKRAW